MLKRRQAVFIFFFVVFAVNAEILSAATITWSAQRIDDASWSTISNEGQVLEAFNLGGSEAVTVNGVTFSPYTSGGTSTYIQMPTDQRNINADFYTGTLLVPQGDSLLDYSMYGQGNLMFTLENLEVGNSYLIQYLRSDDRGGFDDRYMLFDYQSVNEFGSLTTTNYGTDVDPLIVTGAFVADNPSQTIVCVIGGAEDFWGFNAIQFRDLTSSYSVIADDGTAYLRQFFASQAIGYDFTVGSTPLSVSALGIWDDAADDVGYPVGSGTDGSTGGVPDGIAGTVTVQLWQHTSSTTGVKLSEVTIAGTEGFLDGEFRYIELAEPVILAADTTYQVACYSNSSENLFHQFQRMDSTTDIQVSSFINDYTARYSSDAGIFLDKWAGYDSAVAADRMYIGPNLLVSVSGNPALTNPIPLNQDVGLNPQIIFSWDVVNATSPTFEIYIATDAGFTNTLVSHNTGATESYTPSAGLLDYETEYYWRVDVIDGGVLYPGTAWSFTTGGKASGPSPADMGTLAVAQVAWTWSAADWVDSYDVYFGLPDAMVFVDNYALTEVGLDDLAAALGLSTLNPGTYQWRVDTRDSGGVLLVTGDVWTVEVPEDYGLLVIDDFDYYETTANLLLSWSDGSTNGTGSTIAEEMMGQMKLDYSNGPSPKRSETIRTFVPDQDWDISDKAVFALSFRGNAANTANDLYVIISDGTTSLQIMHPVSDVLTADYWQEWYIHTDDLRAASINPATITSLTIGIGDGQNSGSGTVYIDDIRVYMSKCVPEFMQPGDINRDCAVNILDLGLLAESWLLRDYVVTPVQPNSAALMAHYAFDEPSGNTASDSAGTNDATVVADDPDALWNPSGGQDRGCLTMGDDVSLEIPETVWDGITGPMTITFWINGASADYPDRVNRLFVKYPSDASNEYEWASAVWDLDQAGAYGGWNHIALSVETTTGLVRLFHNGRIVVDVVDSSAMTGPGNTMDTSVIAVGIIDGLGGSVLLDELRIYDAALSAEEIAYLAVGSSGSVMQAISPVLTPADVSGDGAVTLLDLAKIASFWQD